MGGKGRKRREKNYKAAHGGYSRLPPPPDRSKLDALPSKLRQLISLTSQPSDSANNNETQLSNTPKLADPDVPRKKQAGSKKEVVPETTGVRDEVDNEQQVMVPEDGDSGDGDDSFKDIENEKKKKKKKKKQVQDLRFIKDLETSGKSLKKRERRKKFLEAKKKKKSDTEEILEFPGHEKIRFGDIVEAPPKLVVPKAFKTAPNASQERLRLQAIEAYRQRKGWSARPGVQLPPPVTM